MAVDRYAVTATWREMVAAVACQWVALDTDWKSVAVGLTIAGLVVGFDVPVPG